MKTISYEQGKLPALTDAQRSSFKALAQMPDESIDTSDIPPLSEIQWSNAVQGRFYKPIKTTL